MTGIQAFARKHLTTLLLLLLAGGFGVLLLELVLYKHFDGMQLVGFFSTVAALVMVLWGIIAKGRVRVWLASLLLVLSVTGIVGVLEHRESLGGDEGARPARVAAGSANQTIADARLVVVQDSDTEGPGQGGDETPAPPLAPLGLTGLALMGAVVLFAKQDEAEAAAKV